MGDAVAVQVELHAMGCGQRLDAVSVQVQHQRCRRHQRVELVGAHRVGLVRRQRQGLGHVHGRQIPGLEGLDLIGRERLDVVCRQPCDRRRAEGRDVLRLDGTDVVRRERAELGRCQRREVLRVQRLDAVGAQRLQLGRAQHVELGRRQRVDVRAFHRRHLAGRQRRDLHRRQGLDLDARQRVEVIADEAGDLAGAGPWSRRAGRRCRGHAGSCVSMAAIWSVDRPATWREFSAANCAVSIATMLSVLSAPSWAEVSARSGPVAQRGDIGALHRRDLGRGQRGELGGAQGADLAGGQGVQVIADEAGDLDGGQRGDLLRGQCADLVGVQRFQLGRGQRTQGGGAEDTQVLRLDGGHLRSDLARGQRGDVGALHRRDLRCRQRGDLGRAQRTDLAGGQGVQVIADEAGDLDGALPVGPWSAHAGRRCRGHAGPASRWRPSGPSTGRRPGGVQRGELRRVHGHDVVGAQRAELCGAQGRDLGGGQRGDVGGLHRRDLRCRQRGDLGRAQRTDLAGGQGVQVIADEAGDLAGGQRGDLLRGQRTDLVGVERFQFAANWLVSIAAMLAVLSAPSCAELRAAIWRGGQRGDVGALHRRDLPVVSAAIWAVLSARIWPEVRRVQVIADEAGDLDGGQRGDLLRGQRTDLVGAQRFQLGGGQRTQGGGAEARAGPASRWRPSGPSTGRRPGRSSARRLRRASATTLSVLSAPICAEFSAAIWPVASAATSALSIVEIWPVLSRLAAIDGVAQAHAQYAVANDSSAVEETPGLPCFSGATLTQRLAAAGVVPADAPGLRTSSEIVVGFTVSGGMELQPWDIVNDALHNLYGRTFLFDPRMQQIGLGFSAEPNGQRRVIVLDTAMLPASAAVSADVWAVWPRDGATGLPTQMRSSNVKPLADGIVEGYPITLHAAAAVKVSRFVITTASSGAPVEATALTAANDRNRLLTEGEAALVPHAPLAAGTTYRVEFEGSADADREAYTLAAAMAVQAALLAGVLYLLAARMVSRPIVRMASALRRMTPGSSERLETPADHAEDEIGMLIAGANSLLESNERQLQTERGLRAEVEAMEAQYRQIFDSSSAGIFVLNEAGRLINGNPTVSRVVGLSMDELRTLSEDGFISRVFNRPEQVRQMIDEATARGETMSADLELVQLGDERRWVHCLISVQHADGQTVEGVIYDITERKTDENARGDEPGGVGDVGLDQRIGLGLRGPELRQRQHRVQPGRGHRFDDELVHAAVAGVVVQRMRGQHEGRAMFGEQARQRVDMLGLDGIGTHVRQAVLPDADAAEAEHGAGVLQFGPARRAALGVAAQRDGDVADAPAGLLRQPQRQRADDALVVRVAVLWVDENSLPNRKLDALARMTQQLMGERARDVASFKFKEGGRPSLAVIGPSSTDALRMALADLRCAADRASAAEQPGTGARGAGGLPAAVARGVLQLGVDGAQPHAGRAEQAGPGRLRHGTVRPHHRREPQRGAAAHGGQRWRPDPQAGRRDPPAPVGREPAPRHRRRGAGLALRAVAGGRAQAPAGAGRAGPAAVGGGVFLPRAGRCHIARDERRAHAEQDCADAGMAREPRPARLPAPPGHRPQAQRDQCRTAAHRRHRHLRQRRARQAARAAGPARGLLRPHVLHDGHGRALPAPAHAGLHAQPCRGEQPAAGVLPAVPGGHQGGLRAC
ncbi:PAS domain S-box protein, partial [Ostertagia ostertagi]